MVRQRGGKFRTRHHVLNHANIRAALQAPEFSQQTQDLYVLQHCAKCALVE